MRNFTLLGTAVCLALFSTLLAPLSARAGDHDSVEELKLKTDGELCFDMLLLCIGDTAASYSPQRMDAGTQNLKARYYVIRDRHHGKAPAWATKLYLVGIGGHYSRDCPELTASTCPSGK